MLINLRNALMAGKRLPYDAEVEYLQSDGQAFVNTGFIVEDGSKITCNIGMDSSYGSTYGYFGASDGTGSYLGGGFNCTSPFSDRRLSVWLKNYLYWCTSANSTNAYQDGSLHTMQFEMSPTIQSVAFDGTAIPYSEGFRSGVNAMPSIPTYLFAVNSAGTAKIAPASAALKIGSFRVEKNGETKLDYIPVRVGAVGYLYDRVTRKLFGNAGTGDFVVGPDVVPVEYIESHGTEYLLTDYNPDSATRVQARFKPTETATDFRWLFAARNQDVAGAGYGFGAGTGGLITSDYNNRVSSPTDVLTNGVSYNIDKNRNVAIYNAATLTNAASTFAVAYPLVIFGLNSHSSVNPVALAKARCFYLTIYNNDVLVRNFQPIRVGTDATSWEGAMMDVLTRRIYRNAGTGAFGYGNDLKYPIPAS